MEYVYTSYSHTTMALRHTHHPHHISPTSSMYMHKLYTHLDSSFIRLQRLIMTIRLACKALHPQAASGQVNNQYYGSKGNGKDNNKKDHNSNTGRLPGRGVCQFRRAIYTDREREREGERQTERERQTEIDR